MCLIIPTNPALVPPSRKRIKVYKFYKQFEVDGTTLTAIQPYQNGRVKILKGEKLRSNRKYKALTQPERLARRIHKGIHAFTSLSKAKEKAKYETGGMVVSLWGYRDDFVARGVSKDIVFTKLEIADIEVMTVCKKVKNGCGGLNNDYVATTKIPAAVIKKFNGK